MDTCLVRMAVGRTEARSTHGHKAAIYRTDFPASPDGPSYPSIVSTIDDDGNEIGGVGQILECVGSSVPFAQDSARRIALNDPRASIAERYSSRNDYLERVRLAAQRQVERQYLLAEDVELCIGVAAERYDAAMST